MNFTGTAAGIRWANNLGVLIPNAGGPVGGDGTAVILFDNDASIGSADPLTLTIDAGQFETVVGARPFPGVDGFEITQV